MSKKKIPVITIVSGTDTHGSNWLVTWFAKEALHQKVFKTVHEAADFIKKEVLHES